MFRPFIVPTLTALASLALVATPLAPASAAEPIEVHPPWEARARASLVHVETAWNSASGVLVGDAKTVYAAIGFLDTGRAIEVQAAAGGKIVEADVSIYAHDWAWAWILSLPTPVDATPLAVSDVGVSPGDHVYVFEDRGRGLAHAQLVEVLVGAIGNGHFTLASPCNGVYPGSPVLDAEGRFIGLLGGNLEVTPAASLADPRRHEERGLSILPVIGYRFGYESGGLMNEAGTFDIDLGVTLADRVSIVGRMGLLFRSPSEGLARLPEEDGEGFGRVAVDDSIGLRLGLEARYRFYLGGGAFPFYLDLSAGLVSSWAFRTASGPTFRSTEPGCDPGSDACPIRLDPTPELDSKSALDASFGIDLRWGPTSLGYRFMPGIGDAPAAHQLLFGVSFF